jgi:uncharacterized membrane protein YgdD (TMEM256/DUF423 family)
MSWICAAALFGTSAVLAGAFGAHGLQSRLSPEQLHSWNTAAHYQLVHSVALLGLGLFQAASGRSVLLPALLFSLGMLLFSGSIYALLLGGPRWLGPVTPLGGLLMIAGWLSLLALAARRPG